MDNFLSLHHGTESPALVRKDGERTVLTHAESLGQAPRKGCVLFFQPVTYIHSFIHSIKARALGQVLAFPQGWGLNLGLYTCCAVVCHLLQP